MPSSRGAAVSSCGLRGPSPSCVCLRRLATGKKRPVSVLASPASCDESSADRPDAGASTSAGLCCFRKECRVCGIIGYVGSRPAKDLLLRGLERLEYRGYDSAGIALRENGGLDYVRAVGNLSNLKGAAGTNHSISNHGLGHTRWATQGAVSEQNWHPLSVCVEGRVAVMLTG